jgi:hypothetical protein
MIMECLKPCSYIRGANYLPPFFVNFKKNDPTVLDRKMGYAERLGLNSVRVFLHYEGWKNNPEAYLNRIKEFMHLVNNRNITVMFVIWDSFRFFNWTYDEGKKKWIYTPDILYSLEPEFWLELHIIKYLVVCQVDDLVLGVVEKAYWLDN